MDGIVSPPDAFGAASFLKGMKVPKRLTTILEGESLVNDASSLIVVKFAIVAVLTRAFSIKEAIGDFFLMAGMGIVVGLLGALIMYGIHRFLPTNSANDAALTVMTPYILFLAAEHYHFSGAMAVVSGGLFMSFHFHEVLNTGSTRLNMLGVCTTIIFVMNTLVFVLIGLELPEIIDGLGDYSLTDGIKYGLIISAIVIGLRFLWVYPSAHIPRWVSEKVRKDPSPGWKGPLVISWAGMRGVVSLATALSIPLLMTNGATFPQRNLIIFITFDKMILLSIVPTSLFYFLGWEWLAIPWVPVALIGTATAFISGFKNTQTYNRTWEARQIYGAIINSSRTFGIMTRDFIRTENNDIHRTIFYRHFAWLTALRFPLREVKSWENVKTKSYNKEYMKHYDVPEWGSSLDEELKNLLSESEREYILSTKNRATQLLSEQSKQLKMLNQNGSITDYSYVTLENQLKDLFDHQGRCERIKNFPYPRQYSSINLYFTNALCYLILLGFIGELSKYTYKLGAEFVWLAVTLSMLVGWIFLVLEQIGESTENPFEGKCKRCTHNPN